MGRAVTFGAPFRDVPTLQPGDIINAETGQGEFVYRVERVRRAGDPLPPPLQAGQARLTLVTAEGDGVLSKDRTVFADALLTTSPQPPVGARAPVQDAAEAPLARQPSALIGLVLWLQLMVLAVGAMTWARIEWGRWETWLVGVPIVLATAVQVCQFASLALLPNLM
jgi:sortase A